jgi:hypothetical protein
MAVVDEMPPTLVRAVPLPQAQSTGASSSGSDPDVGNWERASQCSGIPASLGPIHRFLVGVPGTGRRRACPPLCQHSDRALGGHPVDRVVQHGNTAAALAFPPRPRSVHPFQVYELHARRPGSWMISTVPFSVVWVPFLFGTRIQTITHPVTLSDSFVS